MPKISILSTAPTAAEFAPLQQALRQQTLQDYEFIGEAGPDSLAAWKRAIARSSGEILVFLEAGATPVNERWLAELTAGVTDDRTLVKGLEITGAPLDPSSLAGSRQAFTRHPFDESFPWSEDTEMFCRLQDAGYRFVQLQAAPVIHLYKPGSKTLLRRAFRYGLFWSRLRYRHARPVELMTISTAFKAMIAAFLNLLGIWVGAILYRPKR